MRYVLAIGLETKVYKNPRLEVFLNDRFLGMTNLDESLPAEMQQYKKSDLLDPWNHRPYSNPERIYDIAIPKKWIIYELDDSTFKENNTLDIVPKNLQTNNMNGFVTKADQCKIFSIMLVPKKWFSAEGVQKIFNHCDGRNVIIDFDVSGWPGIFLRDLLPLTNLPTSVQIVYDKILELYIIQNVPDLTLEEYVLPVHTTVKHYYDHAKKYNNNVMDSKKMGVSHPQKPFEINDNTTLLQITNDAKVYMNQIATKYQHNED